ncbi:hypothetical protein BGW38_000701 [Lunasporangiospora selenospora]|uniref:Uncharacterized protein n=1 Tax=Lunasporangiospora selenospora TaxID=979761 RepID=A0A9P6G3T5_9FUNG|nr:hypothetical protein BGW38_000701 [Lunasporangiospora selenospora]
MMFRRLYLLLACVLALCSSAALPNSTALTHLEKRSLSACGAAIVSHAPTIAKYFWKTATVFTKDSANNCLNTLFWAQTMCTSSKPTRTSAVSVPGCNCAYSIGYEINYETFMTIGTNFMANSVSKVINEGTWYGATNAEVDCGSMAKHMTISVSCLGNTVLDRVKTCAGGTYSPAANLIGKATITTYLDKREKPYKPAPCEIRPPYCNRVASTPV